MEKRILWVTIIALLAVDIYMILRTQRVDAAFQELRARSSEHRVEAEYTDEQETLLTQLGAVPDTFPHLSGSSSVNGGVTFYLLVSIDDCTNCIEDEVAKLNVLALETTPMIRGVWGFFVNEDRPDNVELILSHLSPPPVFPVSVVNPLPLLPGATTPLVLVVRSSDGRILDSHKPMPENLTRRDAFYSRWNALLFQDRPWSPLPRQED